MRAPSSAPACTVVESPGALWRAAGCRLAILTPKHALLPLPEEHHCSFMNNAG